MRSIVLSSILLAGLASAQTPAPGYGIIKGTPAPKAAPSPANLANVTLLKGPDGVWKCISAGTKPCTAQEAQAYTAIVKSRSNVKNNLTIAPDGSVHCTNTADGKACSDAAIQDVATQMKAITKGGQQNF